MAPSPVTRTGSDLAPHISGRPSHGVGWQGLNLIVPEGWSPGKFGGTRTKGHLRLDDEEAVRMELRWEENKGSVDVERSVSDFLKQVAKDAKKAKAEFKIDPNVHLVSRSKKPFEQVTNFGWQGSPDLAVGCGYGVSWFCPVCNRVVFAHVLARGKEAPARVERLATEILGSLMCHGTGGWESWSVFGLQVEIPQEFEQNRARLLLNRIELEWVRGGGQGMLKWTKRPERIVVQRFPVANVILEGRTLAQWADATIRWPHKQLALDRGEEATAHGHPATLYYGKPKDLRTQVFRRVLDFVRRRATPLARVLVWRCPVANCLWVVETELGSQNQHVAGDLLDSLQCHG